MAASAVSAFVDDPSYADLTGLRKADLLAIAVNIAARKQALRAEVLAVVTGGLLEQGVITIGDEEESEEEDVEGKELLKISPTRSVDGGGEGPLPAPRMLPKYNPGSPVSPSLEEAAQLSRHLSHLENELRDKTDRRTFELEVKKMHTGRKENSDLTNGARGGDGCITVT